MSKDLDRAKKILEGSDCFTAVAVCGERAETANEKGVLPILRWIRSGVDLEGYSVADKTGGKAAAMLYCLLGIKEVYFQTASTAAVVYLRENGVECEAGKVVGHILNKDRNDMCPIEKLVRDIDSPEEAYEDLVRMFS